MSCYYCGADSITDEHVPPKSFFPESDRINLITVPSCEKHNNDNSNDAEYVRNIISMHLLNNEKGLNHLQQKTFRSFQHSIGLFKTTLQNSTKIAVDGQETLSFGINLDRYNNVFDAIGCALYFRDYNKIFEDEWMVHNYSLITQGVIKTGSLDKKYFVINKMLDELPFENKSTSNPTIFKYWLVDASGKLVYRLEFYEGYIVHLLPKSNIPKYAL